MIKDDTDFLLVELPPSVSFPVRLSPVDQIMPRFYTRLILCMALAAPSPSALDARSAGGADLESRLRGDVFTTLRSALRDTISEIPVIAGVLEPEDGDTSTGKLWITPGTSVKLAYRDLPVTWAYETLARNGFPLSRMDEDVLAPVAVVATGPKPPVFVAQANFLQGGLLLVVCVHHAAMDASGAATLVKTWAHHARDPYITNTLVEEASDRLPLMRGSGRIVNAADHPQYKILNADGRPSSPPRRSNRQIRPVFPPMTTKILHFSSQNLAALKAAASANIPSGGWISTNDALSALLWRSITVARRLPSDENSMLGFAADGRRRIVPSLPDTYVGNVNFFGCVVKPTSVLTSPSGLGEVARAVRSAIQMIDDDRIRDVLELLRGVDVVTDVQPGFNSYLGKDLSITSWANLGLNGLYFGGPLGEIERVRIPNASFDGLCIILPRLADGGLEVVIGLNEEHMEDLVWLESGLMQYSEVMR